jgi:hypothetical protein
MTLAKLEPAKLNSTKVFAFLLIAVAVIAFAYQGIGYTTRENVVDLGPIHVTSERSHTLPLPPIVGVLALLGGIALIILDGKKR